DVIDPNRDKSKGKPHYDLMWDIRFRELPGGKTTVTIRSLFPGEYIRDRFMKTGMADGWSQSLEKLDALLEEVAA
ncbi:MAG: SRPBCC domain-containing protein, partial [Pseudolabrys sp.]|nr:SRPBCC domain-containing protein [Pseudolabrys sp.]